MLDGRVKTLHLKYMQAFYMIENKLIKTKCLKKISINRFDNSEFLSFQNVVNNSKSSRNIVENIDIGGPTLVRAAAKNFKNVAITNKDDYTALIKELNQHNGQTT